MYSLQALIAERPVIIKLGVVVTGIALDEFAAVGFDRYRSTEEWLAAGG